MSRSVSKTKNMALIGVMTAVLCVIAPFSIPIGPVPISFSTLAIFFAVYLLDTKWGTVSVIIYILLGLVGLPVFSGFTGGPAKLFGPTGGYIIGYIFLALISGIFINQFTYKWYKAFAGMLLGTAILYILGTCWLSVAANMNFKAALMAGVIPFIIGDVIKMVIALVIAPQIKGQIIKAGLRQ